MIGKRTLLVATLIGLAPGGAAVASGAAVAPVTVRPAAEQLIADSRAAMPSDSAKARRLANAAGLAFAASAPSASRDIGMTTAKWLEGEALIRLNDLVNAQPIIMTALRTVERIAPRSKLHASLLSSRAGIAAALGQPLNALNDYQRAFNIFRTLGEARDQAVALQNIGSIYQDAADYERVLYYYRLANEAYPNDAILQLSSSNNQANALDELGRHAAAEKEYRRALGIATRLDSTLAKARILDNLAHAQIKQGHLTAAAATLARGLVVVRDTDAAGWYPILLGTAARLSVEANQSQKALDLLKRAFALSGAEALTPRFRDLHFTAYLAHKQRGDQKQALDHFEIYKRLDDRGRSLAASTGATLAAARFDFANQNARIATLKAGQLQRDIALTKLKARQLLIILGALLALVTVVAILLGLYLRSLRRSRDTIGKANLQLVDVNRELEAALLAKTQFLATTSHEIRTPLNGVLGMTQVLLADPYVTANVRERVLLMNQAGEAMRALVDDILDSAKTDGSSFEIARERGNLHELLNEGVKFWAAKAEEAGLDLSLDLGSSPEFIIEDMRRLRQIVFNIVANALKFTLQGSVTIKARAMIVDGNEHLNISITDTGIGIAQNNLSRIFERFIQVDGSTTRRFSGTGLGLSICRNLARSLGGDVLVTSEVSIGSEFTVLLPLYRDTTYRNCASLNQRRAAATLEDSSLLVVGANPLARGMLSAVFRPVVSRLAFAASLDDAQLAMRAGPIDLVLVEGTALSTEGSTGIDRLREFGEERSGAGLLVITLWPAAATDLEMTAVVNSGIAGVIQKPISADNLVARLRAAIAAGSTSRTDDVARDALVPLA